MLLSDYFLPVILPADQPELVWHWRAHSWDKGTSSLLNTTGLYSTVKATGPKGIENDTSAEPPDLSAALRDLDIDLWLPDHQIWSFMPLSHVRHEHVRVPICTKIGLFVFSEQTDGQVENITAPPVSLIRRNARQHIRHVSHVFCLMFSLTVDTRSVLWWEKCSYFNKLW